MPRLTQAEWKTIQPGRLVLKVRPTGVPKRRVRRGSPEHDEQVTVIQWAVLERIRKPALYNLFAVPNEGKRSWIVGKRMKAEGLMSGVPDLLLDVPRGGYHGLRIELKVLPNKPTANQRDWIKRLIQQGYYVRVCYGAPSAIEVIQDYLALPELPRTIQQETP